MQVDSRDPRPAYVQIADAFREQIRLGQLSPGDRLPATRALAEQVGAAQMTVRKAIDQLAAEGFVVAQQGRGVFVATADPQAARPDSADVQEALADLRRRVARLEQLLEDPANRPG